MVVSSVQGWSCSLPCRCPQLVDRVNIRLQPILEHYRGLSLPPEAKKLRRWLENIKQHPAVKATQRHPEEGPGDDGKFYEQELLKHYSKYAGGLLHLSAA